MDDRLFESSSTDDRPAARFEGSLRYEFLESCRISIACRHGKSAILGTIDEGPFGAAETRDRFDECVEYCLKIEGRSADDLENIGGRSLSLQRFTQLTEQPRVLDCNHGLISEGCQ